MIISQPHALQTILPLLVLGGRGLDISPGMLPQIRQAIREQREVSPGEKETLSVLRDMELLALRRRSVPACEYDSGIECWDI